jgi:outer membrane lipoprotein-sorting protein
VRRAPFVIALALGLGLGLAAVATPAAAASGPRERWSAAFRSLKDARASFRQTRDAGALGRMISQGTMEFRAPSLVRIDYTGSAPMTILLRGDTAWVHQPRQKQVLRSSARASGVPPLPFLTAEPGRLDERFDIVARGDDTIVFTPKQSAALSWSACELTVHPATGLPTRAVVRMSDGSSIELVFDRFRVNAGVAASRFRPSWPPGTAVVVL